MGKNYRQGLMGEEIRRIVSGMLLTGVKDPRLTDAMISITDVEVTSDNSYDLRRAMNEYITFLLKALA